MPKVRIYRKLLKAADEEALLQLLELAGCELVEAEEAETEEPGIAPDQVEAAPADEVLIVLINPGCEPDTDLEIEVRGAADVGCRVIGVWPRGTSTGKVPPALEKYGSDIISWSPETVREAVDGSSPQWETPAGTPRAEPVTKRNRC
jgi:hypothetical protein